MHTHVWGIVVYRIAINACREMHTCSMYDALPIYTRLEVQTISIQYCNSIVILCTYRGSGTVCYSHPGVDVFGRNLPHSLYTPYSIYFRLVVHIAEQGSSRRRAGLYADLTKLLPSGQTSLCIRPSGN